MKKILTVLLSLTLLMLSAAACTGTTENEEPSASPSESAQTPEASADASPTADPYAETIGFTIEMENGDIMKGELYPNLAPKTVENFVKLCNEHFYDGLIFHRVIPGFMIQGGCPLGTGTGGPGYHIKGEFKLNGFKNKLNHTRGVLSMARAMTPNSAGSQFFIMHADAPHLDGQYAAFGKVISGMEAVDKIAAVPTDFADRPTQDQRMKKVTVDTFGVDYPEPEKV